MEKPNLDNYETPEDLNKKYKETWDYEPDDETIKKMGEYLDDI